MSKLTNKLENVEQQQIQLALSLKDSPGSTSSDNINEHNKRVRTDTPKPQYRSTSILKNVSQTEKFASLDFPINTDKVPTFSSSFNVPSSPPPAIQQEDRLDRLEATASQAFNSLNNIHQQLAKLTSPVASPTSQQDTNMEFSNSQSSQ